MKSQMLQLHPDGTISTESLDWKAAAQRMQARRDPAGIERMSDGEKAAWLEAELLQIGVESANLDADITAIQQLSFVAASLESLADTVSLLMVEGNSKPEHVSIMENLASMVSAPADATRVELTNNVGVVSTEAISSRVKSVFVAIVAGIKKLISDMAQLFSRFRGLNGKLRQQLKNQQNGLRQYKTVGLMEFTPTLAMSALVDGEGEFDSTEALATLRRLNAQFTWCTNILAPETTQFISDINKWIAALDLSSDETLVASFEKIKDIKVPVIPSDWERSKDNSVQRGFKALESELTFGNHVFTAIVPNTPSSNSIDYLSNDVMSSVIEYDYKDGETVVANDDLISVNSVSDINEMITLSLGLLDLQEALQGHTTKMTKELNGLMTAGQWLMDAAAKAETLDDSSVAKIVMAIQSPQSIAMRVESPFRSVLYETTRVVTGVASLATKAKTALDSAE